MEELIKEVVGKFDELKKKEVVKKESYGDGFESVIGSVYWDNPNLLWVLVTNNEEDYEGHQSQIGINKEGK